MKIERPLCLNCHDEPARVTIKFDDALDDAYHWHLDLCLDCWNLLKHLTAEAKDYAGYEMSLITFQTSFKRAEEER